VDEQTPTPVDIPVDRMVPFRTRATRETPIRWCSCGLSATQPFCDFAHRGTGHRPMVFQLPEDITVALCGCKATRSPPYCDGSHLTAVAAKANGSAT
jgi:CDGSH-type Zn-finger protein